MSSGGCDTYSSPSTLSCTEEDVACDLLSVFHTVPIIILKWLSSRFRSFLLPEEGFNLLLKLGPHYYD